MANKDINYIKIRKIDANGATINLNLQDSIGDTLTFKKSADNVSRWIIETLQEFPTYYLLGVIESNNLYGGKLSQVFNNMINSLDGGNVTLVNSSAAGVNIDAENVPNADGITGVGEGAILRFAFSNTVLGAASGNANIMIIMDPGKKYQVGDRLKFTVPNYAGGTTDVFFILTEDNIMDATNEIVVMTGVPDYDVLRFEGSNSPYGGTNYGVGPSFGGTTIKDYSLFNGQTPYSYNFALLPTANKGGADCNTPQHLDGTYENTTYGWIGYQFGMQPQMPIQFELEFKNISSSIEGDFFFNMYQYQDKLGDQLNPWCGKFDGTGKLINYWRGFGLSSSFDINEGQTLTGPVKITTTQMDFKISGSIRADFIESGSIWYWGVSRHKDLSDAVDLAWQEMTASISHDPDALFYYKAVKTTQDMTNPQFTSKTAGPHQVIGPQTYFSPYNGLWTQWWNNSWNPILGNVDLQRPNTNLMLIEHNHQTGSQVPSNRFQIISGTATPAEVPDSNYTQRRVIWPRYEGSRLQSADYNQYSRAGQVGRPPSIGGGWSGFSPFGLRSFRNPAVVQFLNGDTCSIAPEYWYPTSSNVSESKQWYGDISYGKKAVVDRYPRYIAHFKKSIDDYLYFGSRKFDLDALIEIPHEDITGNAGFTPTTLPLDGDGDYQPEVASTFEAGREAAALFNTYQSKYEVDGNSGSINMFFVRGRRRKRLLRRTGKKRILPKSGEIFDGGFEYVLLNTNEAVDYATSENEGIEITPNYAYRKGRQKIVVRQGDEWPNTPSVWAFTNSIQMITGSSGFNLSDNFFILSGSMMVNSGSTSQNADQPITGDVTRSNTIPFARIPYRMRGRYVLGMIPNLFNLKYKNFYALGGPQLAVFHTHNYYLKNRYYSAVFTNPEQQYSSDRRLAFQPGVSSRRGRNYWKFMPKAAGAPGYENSREAFLIEPGDEIRVEAEVLTAGYMGHTGSLNTGKRAMFSGIPSFWDGSAVASVTSSYAMNCFERRIGSGYGDPNWGQGSGTTWQSVATTTNGQGQGATVEVTAYSGTYLGGKHNGGWLAKVADKFIVPNISYMNDCVYPGQVLINAVYPNVEAKFHSTSPQQSLPATGQAARFNVTISTGETTELICTCPGEGYENGAILTFDIDDLGGDNGGTLPPRITLGTKIGVGRAAGNKMGFTADSMTPSDIRRSDGTQNTTTLEDCTFTVTYTGETNNLDAVPTDIQLNKQGTFQNDDDYIIFYPEHMVGFGAGFGKPINGDIDGVTGSMQVFNPLVLRCTPGTIAGGVTNIEFDQPGYGYAPGDEVYVPSQSLDDGTGLVPYGDIVLRLEPAAISFTDNSTTTRTFGFQVLAVSQSNYWSGSFKDERSYAQSGFYGVTSSAWYNGANNFTWEGITTGSGQVIAHPYQNHVNLVNHINGVNPINNAAAAAAGVTTTLIDSPFGNGAGSGLILYLRSNMDPVNGKVDKIWVWNGGGDLTLGNDYSPGDVLRVNAAASAIGSNDFYITLPAQALFQNVAGYTGSLGLKGAYGGIADKLYVHPNPKEVLYGIDKGEVKKVTFRKRKNTDTAAMLLMDTPSGSRGRLTPSGDGFLIPQDLSRVQRKNALNIINKLNAQNAFRINKN